MMTLRNRAITIQAMILVGMSLAAASIGGIQQAVSVLAGAVIFLISLALMAWSIDRILQKKSVALALSVIVIKYLLLAVALYWFVSQPWLNLIWFVMGVAGVVMAAVLIGLTAEDLI